MRLMIVLIVTASIGAAPATKPALRLRDDAPEELKRLFEKTDGLRPAALRESQAQLKKARAVLSAKSRGRVIRGANDSVRTGPNGDTYVYGSSDSKMRALDHALANVERARKDIERVETAPIFFPFTTDVQKLTPGWIGRVGGAKVVQVIDGSNLIVSVNDQQSLWIGGIDTAGITDDSFVFTYGIGPVVMITGTKTRDTAIDGSGTVLQAEPFDVDHYIVRDQPH